MSMHRRQFIQSGTAATFLAALKLPALAAEAPTVGLIFPPANYPIPPDAGRLYPSGVRFIGNGLGFNVLSGNGTNAVELLHSTATANELFSNTIGTDRAFLAKFMPRVDSHLHYRSVDVSSIKELSRRWYPRVYFQAPAKHGGHRALADILESIRELEYYRSAVFVPAPGPTSDEAHAAAAAAVESWAPRVP